MKDQILLPDSFVWSINRPKILVPTAIEKKNLNVYLNLNDKLLAQH